MTAGITFGAGINAGSGISIGPIFVPPSVVAYYNAGDSGSYSGTGTTWYDLSGQGNDLTFQGSTITYTSAGAASYFSTGANGFFNRTNATNLPVGNDNYTFALWVNSPGWNASGMISIGPFGSGNESNALRTAGYPILINYWWGNDFAIGTDAPLTDWFYVVATFDGTTRSIYVNGVLQGSDNPSGHNVTNSNLQVGQTLSGEFFNGNIGQVWIYNFGLTGTDILANYNATKSIYGL